MDIWSLDKLILFILFVIPGFITLKVYEIASFGENERESSKKIIDAITYSCINYSILGVPIFMIESGQAKETNEMFYYFFYFIVLLIAPILWALIWIFLRKLELFQSIAPHPISKPWDYVFSQRKEYWIKVTLRNGKIVGGKYSMNSFSSSSPSVEQIYLEESWFMNKDGGFNEQKENTNGILILQNQISYIEFFEY